MSGSLRNQFDASSFSVLDGEDSIVIRAVRGEASAFGLLYDHYQPKIYRFVFLKVSHREEAEDLTHQIFVSAWQNITSYVPRGLPFASWLYRIARNQVIDYYRTSKPQVSIDEVNPELFATPASLEIDATVKQLLAHVHRELKTLKPEYQDVIIMRFVEEFSIKETAQALGKSQGAVKLLQHRALNALRKIVDESQFV